MVVFNQRHLIAASVETLGKVLAVCFPRDKLDGDENKCNIKIWFMSQPSRPSTMA